MVSQGIFPILPMEGAEIGERMRREIDSGTWLQGSKRSRWVVPLFGSPQTSFLTGRQTVPDHIEGAGGLCNKFVQIDRARTPPMFRTIWSRRDHVHSTFFHLQVQTKGFCRFLNPLAPFLAREPSRE